MTDPLREILRSPLDDMPDPRVSGPELLIIALALLVGIAGGWIAAGPGAQTAATTTTTTPSQVEPLDLPPGWTDTGLGYAVSISWMYTRGADLFMGIAVSNRAGDDPVAPGFTALGFDRRGIGLWTVELSGGERIVHSREMFDVNAPGVITVEFADAGATVDDIRSVSLRPASGYGVRVQRVSLALDGLPEQFAGIEPIAATERVENGAGGTERTDLTFVTIDELSIDWSNAALAWTLQDAPDVRVMLETTVSIEGDTTEPVQLATIVGGGAFLQRSFPPLSPAAAGSAVLRKIGGATGASYTPERAAVEITLSWLRYDSNDIDVVLDLAERLDPIE